MWKKRNGNITYLKIKVFYFLEDIIMYKLKMGDKKGDFAERQAEYRNLKMQLANVLCQTPFCCLCLKANDLSILSAPVYFQNWETNYFVTMKFVIQKLFSEKVSSLASDHICISCKETTLNTFVFLLSTERNLEIIEDYINQLDKQIDDTDDLISNSNDHKFANMLFVIKDPTESKIMTMDSKIEETESSNESSNDNLSDDEEDTITNKHECDYCDRKFEMKSGKINHVRRVHKQGSQYCCPECHENDCPHRQYLEPMEKVHRKSCIDCDYVCWSKISLISHVNKEHLLILPFLCELCAKPLHSSLAYKQHMYYYHTSFFNCAYCERHFSNMDDLQNHESTCKHTTREFKCHSCAASFETEDKLINHKKKHENVQLPCDSCDKKFMSEGALTRHKILTHEKTVNTKRRAQHLCTICHTDFQTRKEKYEHMKEHGDDEKHCCLHCNLEFDTAKEYQVHTNKPEHIANSGFNKTFSCPHCNYIARAEFVLEAHVNRYHLKQAPYKCTECEKKFTNAFNLKCHKKIHTKSKNKYMCKLCEKTFCGPSALKKHIRIHTGERPYSCEICGEGYISSSMLKMHQKSQHGTKNIQCPLCPLLFCALSYMRMHVKKTHWTSKEKFDIRKIKGLTEEQYDMFRDRRHLVLK